MRDTINVPGVCLQDLSGATGAGTKFGEIPYAFRGRSVMDPVWCARIFPCLLRHHIYGGLLTPVGVRP